MMKMRVVLIALCCALTLTAQDEKSARVRVTNAADALLKSYDKKTGLFLETGWWNSANGITALARASAALHTRRYEEVFGNTWKNAPKKFPGFLNEFYDDEGWWALAWLDVYDLTKDKRYLKTSESIFADMTTGWDETCGGGIWWKKNTKYKNAIANELFLSVAARLAATEKDDSKRAEYLQWARKEAEWFTEGPMINGDHLVNDGLAILPGPHGQCVNNNKTTWSYNQGVIVGGLVQLQALTPDEEEPLVLAGQIASAAATHLVDKDGVLHDPCEPQCGVDGVQFKGIFMRNLVPLLQRQSSPPLQTFADTNADAIWNKARTEDTRFACSWSGPAVDDKTGSLISALDGLVTALQLQ